MKMLELEGTTYDFSFESEVWRAFFGKRTLGHFSKRKKKAQSGAIELHRKMFHPESGIQDCIPQLLLHWADLIDSGDLVKESLPFGRISQFHPDALRFLAEFGSLQDPFVFVTKPSLEPMPGRCFENAHFYVRTHSRAGVPMLYSEGVVLGAATNPMLHAWNTEPKEIGVAIDWTLYASSRWNKYFGISITLEEHIEANSIIFPDGQSYGLIFDRICWDGNVRDYLAYVLSWRKRELRFKEEFKMVG